MPSIVTSNIMNEILVTQYALANPLDLLVCLEILGYLGINKYKITKTSCETCNNI